MSILQGGASDEKPEEDFDDDAFDTEMAELEDDVEAKGTKNLQLHRLIHTEYY